MSLSEKIIYHMDISYEDEILKCKDVREAVEELKKRLPITYDKALIINEIFGEKLTNE